MITSPSALIMLPVESKLKLLALMSKGRPFPSFCFAHVVVLNEAVEKHVGAEVVGEARREKVGRETGTASRMSDSFRGSEKLAEIRATAAAMARS